jgi:chemotaxis signal transduction protein
LPGRCIPVIALTRLLDLPPARRNSRRFVIVLPLDFPPASALVLGLLVDAVSSVVRIPAARIAPPDPAAPPASTGRVRINGRFKYLLEPALLLPPEQISQVCGLPAAVAGPVA